MRRFLIRSILFAAIYALPFCIGYFLIKRANYFKLPEGREYVLLGDSQSECAFNDSLIPELLNFCIHLYQCLQ